MLEIASHRRRRRLRRPPAIVVVTTLLALLGGGVVAARTTGQADATELARTPHYNLSLAIQQSLYFYDAQKSGPARSLGRQPLEWRGDSEVNDARIALQPIANGVGTNLTPAFIERNRAVLDPDGDGTVDLSGGFHDAAGQVKFGLPQAYAASTIGWGMYEFKDAFVATGTWNHAMDELRWFTDYFLRSAFTDPAGDLVAFAYQVGDGSVDRAYWGPPELQSDRTYPRPAYFASPDDPASDQTASHAAALAIMSMLVADDDPAYARRCLDTAKALYAFSIENRGLGYSGGFYDSSSDEDEMSWGAVWLYLATGNRDYLDDIVSTDSRGRYNGYLAKLAGNQTSTWRNRWVHSWETKWGGVFSLLDSVIHDDRRLPEKVRTDIHYFNKWQIEYWSRVPHDDPDDQTFLATSPSGYAVLSGWGSARYNTAAQLEALAYRRHFPDDPKSERFTDWAMGQLNYLLGDNPLKRSYLVGFGSTTPHFGDLAGGAAEAAQHPHHAAAHGSTTNNPDEPATHRHILWGALVGGPDLRDEHADRTTEHVSNEVAVDYNAALVGALAGLWLNYGQDQPMASFIPPPEPQAQELYSYAKVDQATSRGTQVTVTVNNFASRPPHYQTDLSARYFFNISEIHQQGQTIKDVAAEGYRDASATSQNQPAKITGPARWGGPNSCLYYVTIDWAGVEVFGAREFRFGLTEAQTPNWKNYWDAANDPSYQGLSEGEYGSTPDPHVPVYAGGKLVFGTEPPATADESCGASDPGTPTGPAILTAQYSNSSASAASAQIANKIQLANSGQSPVALDTITIRYWLTGDTAGSLSYFCDFAPMGCANIRSTFKVADPVRAGADRYLELSFTSDAGKLWPGTETGPIQNRITQTEFGLFDQSNDYSYGASAASLGDWTRITIYQNGDLVFGTEPS